MSIMAILARGYNIIQQKKNEVISIIYFHLKILFQYEYCHIV